MFVPIKQEIVQDMSIVQILSKSSSCSLIHAPGFGLFVPIQSERQNPHPEEWESSNSVSQCCLLGYILDLGSGVSVSSLVLKLCSVTFDHFNLLRSGSKALPLKSSVSFVLASHLKSDRLDTNCMYLQLFPSPLCKFVLI